MSSIVRVYNVFTQIKNNLDGENNILGQALLKKVFKVENDDDLNYLKPYIFQEIDNCETEMRAGNYSDEQISSTIPKFKTYIQDVLFNQISALKKSIIIVDGKGTFDKNLLKTKDKSLNEALTLISFAAPRRDQFKEGYEAQIEKIKGEVASLKNEFLQLNKADDYVYSFILLNLDRIDILLNNFDKISPKYIEFNLYAIITPVYTINEYEKLKHSVKSLWDNIVGFTNTYGGCVCTVYTLADIAGKLLLKTP